MHEMTLASSTCDLIQSLFEHNPQPIILSDADLNVAAVNRSASELLDISPEDDPRRIDELLGGFVPQELRDLGGSRTVREWSTKVVTGSGGRSVRVRAASLSDANGWAFYLNPIGASDEVPAFVGRSPVAQELVEFVSRIAASRASSIILEAETGAGKEVIARRLHALSSRARGRFVAVNCAAMPETLLESELFGHERGAFTDARTAKTGLIEAANGGTLFLDEIVEMPLSVQAKLLRVLEDRAVRRIGGVEDTRVDVRVVAATNRDLTAAIDAREFRSDLYYRLNVVQIRIPPLRTRGDDIEDLAVHFLEQFNEIHGTHITGIDPEALRLLKRHRWPGNVRELRNVIERAVLVESSPTLTVSSIQIPGLPADMGDSEAAPVENSLRRQDAGSSLCLRSTERDLIAAALAQVAGNQTQAAALLGIGRFSLRYKMRKFGLL
jgi:transcriptional regulator with PAS, ATPase and Fis domain